ncbi:O-acetyl-ADP-ribose deacetylase [Flavobacterium filum]|uniref:O-acetyl-ADP-ribose deacetylase n=1 Tax=Flavobacterium filum TaxID=370974 RepID=UPI003211E102
MTNSRNILELQKGDITKVTVDAIVNAANTSLLGGGGVDGAIHRAGGRAILEDCRKIIAKQGGCKVGQAIITTAGNLPSNFVIHTVGPVWNGGQKTEREKLANCYRSSLQLAVENSCKTIAFPNISTGIYKFPKKEAARIAVDTVLDFVHSTNKIEKVIFVCFDDENFYYIKRYFNFKVFTIPSKLFANNELLGTVNIGLEDDGQGVLSGQLEPTENYNTYRDFFRDTFLLDATDNLIRINKFTSDNKFKVVADDGTEFKNPIGGLLIYDFENEPINVELCGIEYEIWKNYFN